jgi:hypothetical protein
MSTAVAIVGGLPIAVILLGFVRGLVRLAANKHQPDRSDGMR